jgi:peptidoglycan/LPS O-acetylase OafA/YrhL
MQTQQHPYLSRLDHLRFLAASLVVLFHFFHFTHGDLKSGNPLVSLVDEGHTGIALFMVISGFIFTVIAGDKDIHYAGFIRNRIIRIYPLLIVAACLQLFVSTYNDHRNYGFMQLLGWLIPFRSETIGLSPYFQQMWTIWVELQFYLLFPFLILFARRYGSRYLWGVLGLMFVLRALVFAASGEVRYISYETLFGRLDQFVVGMLLGRMWVAKNKTQTAQNLQFMWLLPATLLVLAVLHLFSLKVGFAELKSPVWVVWPLLEGAVWGSFVWVYLRVRWPGPELLKGSIDKGLAALGAVSFSTYVFHNLVLAAYNKHAGIVQFTGVERFDSIMTGLVVVLPLVMLMSALSYHLIEKPFLSMRKAYLSPRTPPLSAELRKNNSNN